MMEETQDNIVEALPASCSTEDTSSHQSPSKLKTQPKQGNCNQQTPTSRLTHPDVTSHQSQAKQGICTSQTSSSSRFTRSQAAPDWTVQEVLVLLSEIVAVDDDWFKALSSYQRWKMISDNCIAMDVVRSSNQCKRKWEMLLTDYRKIRKWESRSRGDSYWFLQEEKRKEYGLPGSFQKEVFEAIVAVIEVQQYQYDSKNNDPKQIIRVPEIETPNVEVDSELGRSTLAQGKPPLEDSMESDFNCMKPLIFNGEGFNIWAIRMKTYLEAMDLWDAIEDDYVVPPLPPTPTQV